MKFLANENFPVASFLILKGGGMDIKHIGISNPSISDEAVMQLAKSEDRVIITFDGDYGELVFKKGYPTAGVIYLRIKEFMPEMPARIIKDLLAMEGIIWNGYFSVFDDGKLRQRKI
ncbi:MAG: DUF5615 family PIN-like protein [Saprospiraceae bacterium]|nr:DUF5615 family PIN-like protein [Saprospiraceae bacterium]